MEKVEQDWHISSHDTGKEHRLQNSFKLFGEDWIQKKIDILMPYDLTVKNLMVRIFICESLLKRNEFELFLKWLITGDGKWITYDNNVRKRLWSKQGEAPQMVAKPGLTPKKDAVCVGLKRNCSL